jgi:putative membrane protein
MKLESWVRKYLKSEDLAHIETCVAEAEKLTSGEIVPMIVRRSSSIGHVAPMLLMMFLLLFFVIIEIVELEKPGFGHSWWTLIGGFLVSFLATRFLANSPRVQYFFINKIDGEWLTKQRAKIEFYEARLEQTKGSTGILLFVSLMERRAVVLADRGIAGKLPESTWDEVVMLLVRGAKSRDLGSGMVQAIQRCQVILSEHFPKLDGDRDELANRPIIKE